MVTWTSGRASVWIGVNVGRLHGMYFCQSDGGLQYLIVVVVLFLILFLQWSQLPKYT
jgi:hypothetical protein